MHLECDDRKERRGGLRLHRQNAASNSDCVSTIATTGSSSGSR
jgi:hypothetical protein